jgi:hypothetical protein
MCTPTIRPSLYRTFSLDPLQHRQGDAVAMLFSMSFQIVSMLFQGLFELRIIRFVDRLARTASSAKQADPATIPAVAKNSRLFIGASSTYRNNRYNSRVILRQFITGCPSVLHAMTGTFRRPAVWDRHRKNGRRSLSGPGHPTHRAHLQPVS